MTREPVYMSGLGAVIVAGALLTACGGAPSGTEFVEACLREGQSAASQMLEMNESEQTATVEVLGRMLEQCGEVE